MKKLVLIFMLLSSLSIFSQGFQNLAPWMKSESLKNKSNLTINDVSVEAEKYFNTIDKSKKGSGLKPFERWKYHWSFYTKADGSLMTAQEFWKAWEEKQQRNEANTTSRTVTDNSNWQSIGPNNSSNTYSANNNQSSGQGRINTIAVDPNDSNTYYVGAPAGGLWRSKDAGQTWTPLTDQLPQIGVSGIAIDPNNSNIIYIATGDDDAGHSYSVGVMKTTDGGVTWNSTGSMIGNPDSMNEIYIDPSSTNILLVATSTGVFKTIDGGATWVRKLSGNIIDLKMKPGDSSTWYAVSSNTFFRSTDGGENFNGVNIPSMNGSTRLAIDVSPANPNYVVMLSAGANSSFNGVYQSTNSGASFTKAAESSDIFGSSQAWYDMALAVSDVNTEIIFVGVLNVWKTDFGGLFFWKINDWYDPNTPDFTHADIHFMRYINGKLFAGTDGGIYVSDDDGDTFTNLTAGLEISQFYKISVSPLNSERIVGGIQDNGGMSFSAGKLWKNYHGGDGMEGNVDPTEPDTFYGFIQYGGSLYKSTNNGDSNQLVASAPSAETGPGDDGGNWVTPMAINSTGVVYGGYSQLYKIENNSWVQVSNAFFGGNLDTIEIDPNDDNNIYVTKGSKLYRSTDAGVSFTQLTFNNGTVRKVEVSKNNSNIVWVVTSSRVYKSTNILDGTPTFTDVAASSTPSETLLSLAHHNNSGKNTIYLGTTLGVYYINDDITDWQVFDNNLPNVKITDLEISEMDNKLYAATFGRGVFTTVIDSNLAVDDVAFAKEVTVYPNPSEAIFNLSWSNGEKASIKVYNYIGQVVLEKKNIHKNYPLDLSNFNRGIYFVRMNVDGKLATKKLILK